MRNFYIEKKSLKVKPVLFCYDKIDYGYIWTTAIKEYPVAFVLNNVKSEYSSRLHFDYFDKIDFDNYKFIKNLDWKMSKNFNKFDEMEMLTFFNLSFKEFYNFYMQEMKNYVECIFSDIGTHIDIGTHKEDENTGKNLSIF